MITFADNNYRIETRTEPPMK